MGKARRVGSIPTVRHDGGFGQIEAHQAFVDLHVFELDRRVHLYLEMSAERIDVDGVISGAVLLFNGKRVSAVRFGGKKADNAVVLIKKQDDRCWGLNRFDGPAVQKHYAPLVQRHARRLRCYAVRRAVKFGEMFDHRHDPSNGRMYHRCN